MLRTDYSLYLYKPDTVEEQKLGQPFGGEMPAESSELLKTFKSKVGGIGGLGASEATSVIRLDKLVFAPGEKIRVNIDHDNSTCKKPVKSFKIKLQRVITCMSGKKTN